MRSLYDRPTDFRPHTPAVAKLGHAISIVAKMLATLDKDEFAQWDTIQDTIITSLMRLVKSMTVKEAEEWLTKSEHELNEGLYAAIFEGATDLDDEEQEINDRLRREREKRSLRRSCIAVRN